MALKKLFNQKIDNYYVSVSFLTKYQIEKFTRYCADNYQHKNYSFNIDYEKKNNSNVFPFLFLLTKQEKKKNEIALRNGKKHTITFNGERFKKTCGEMIKINTQMNMIINIKDKKKLNKNIDEQIQKKRRKIDLLERFLDFQERRIDNAYNDDNIPESELDIRTSILMDSMRRIRQQRNRLVEDIKRLQTKEEEFLPFVYNFIPPPPIAKKTDKNKTIKESFINKKFLNLYNIKKKIGNYYLFSVYIVENHIKNLNDIGIKILRKKSNKKIDLLVTPFEKNGTKLMYLYLTKTQIKKINNIKRRNYLDDPNILHKRYFTLIKLSKTQISKTFLKVIELNTKLEEDKTSKMTKRQIKFKRFEPKTRNLIDFTPSDDKDLIDFTGPDDQLMDFTGRVRNRVRNRGPVGDLIDFRDYDKDLIDFGDDDKDLIDLRDDDKDLIDFS